MHKINRHGACEPIRLAKSISKLKLDLCRSSVLRNSKTIATKANALTRNDTSAETRELEMNENHRRKSSVNFRGQDIFARKICEKLTKCPNFTWFMPEKLIPEFLYLNEKMNKIPNFRWFLIINQFLIVNQCPNFYIIISRKIFSHFIFFLGGEAHVPPCPRLLKPMMRNGRRLTGRTSGVNERRCFTAESVCVWRNTSYSNGLVLYQQRHWWPIPFCFTLYQTCTYNNASVHNQQCAVAAGGEGRRGACAPGDTFQGAAFQWK